MEPWKALPPLRAISVDLRAAGLALGRQAAGRHDVDLFDRGQVHAGHEVAGRHHRAEELTVTQLLEVRGAAAVHGELLPVLAHVAADVLVARRLHRAGQDGDVGARVARQR